MLNDRSARFNMAHNATSVFDTSESLFKLLVKALERTNHPTSIAEFGCGKGHHLKSLPKEMTKKCFDISEVAIEYAKNSCSDKSVDFVTHDLLNSLDERFDIILDSHLFHCLLSTKELSIYLQNCLTSLNPGGLLVLETMISHGLYNEYFASEIKDNVLHYNGQPIRTICHERDIENLILESGFEIDQLIIPFGKKIILKNYAEVEDKYHPDCIQIICKKPLV